MRKKVDRQPSREGLATPNVISLAARDTRLISETLPAVQAAFLASRFGLDGNRARLTAELAWGRA